MTDRILILGGTTEARELAARLAARGNAEITLSLAGRTARPAPQPVPMRVGGFGGAGGLVAHLREHRVDLLIDATHPYAARMSANASEASRLTGVPLVSLRRPPWTKQPGDRWIEAVDANAAVQTLGREGKKVFLALGRQEILAFEAAPQHDYLVRSVDAVEPPLAVPRATYVLARGPFTEIEDRALLEQHAITHIVAKNSGGQASYGKIAAARALGIEVILLRRPELPQGDAAASLAEALAMIDHALASRRPAGASAAGAEERGV